LKSSYLTAGITLRQLFKILKRNSFSWQPRYLFRLFFLMQGALWSSVFAWIENLTIKRKLERTDPLPDPIFIIGHWRTGSTFLHKLMSLDPHLYTPTLYDVAIPDSCLTSYSYYSPFMSVMVSKRRPMDNVRLGINEPQEDEYALYRLTSHSPLEKLIFPENKSYFLLNHTVYLPPASEVENWNQNIRHFYHKLFFKSGKTIVSKNPFNSMRIKELHQLFPKARFIHITRHPFDVVPSTRHMFGIVQYQNALNENEAYPELKEVTIVLNRFLETIRKDSKTLPPELYTEVKFEDFEKDTIGALKTLYHQAGLSFSTEFHQNIQLYLSAVKGYKKNRFNLSDEEKSMIQEIMRLQMEISGY
jgi:hypothetical protein